MFDPLVIIKNYYQEGSEAYKILIEHSKDVGQKALAIAERKPELKIDKEFVYNSALLHDIGIFMTYAPSIACYGEEKYIRHGYLGAELMRRLGYPEYAFVCERHTGSGLTMSEIRSQGIDLPDGVYLPQSIEEKLICYADKFFSKSKLGEEKSLDKVFRSMAKFGAEPLRRFEELHQIFK